ncbi:cuticle protein 19-like isoform X2 [Penaeus japonicus]|uniref:cuticle protein 19-like isoform X1 n=1 Tax=Penaeus japonicus TaxID=27405 RepID=UPI001C710325|nr:cuticle protein 19-like isoform X1 [Penaeus japonicus]XP_042893532.1 cuticle protein 19-like isoform X2 [Penaeus japonicus]
MKGFVTVTSLCFLAFSFAAPDQLGHHEHSRHAHSPPQNGYRLPPPPPPPRTYTTVPPPPPPPPTYQRPTTTPPYPAYIYGPPVTTTEKPKYWFEWDVNDHYSGNEYNMQEHRDGEKTEGFYTVLLPDTRVQKVAYTIDGDSGFVAEVTYEGEAKGHENKHEYLLPSPPTPHTPIYGVPHPSG